MLGQLGNLPYLGLGVHFGSELDCRVFMHTRIDALTCPCFWVVIIVSVRHASMPLDTLLHPVSITLTTLHTVCTGLSSFQLVPMSTVLAVQVYIFGSLLPPTRHIILPRGTHQTYIGRDLFRNVKAKLL